MVRENTQRKEEFITPDDLNDRVELDQSSSENEGPQADVEDSQDTVEAGGEILAVAHEVNVLEDALKEAARVFVERVAQYADQTAVTGGMPRGDVVPIHELRQRQELKTAISNLNLTTEQAATLLRGAVENVAPGVGNPSIAEGATEACGEAIAALEDPSVSPDGVSESADKASESAEEVAEHLDEVGEKLNEMAEEEKGEGSGTGV